jgi:UDP-N-acetylglucosamine 2-epimerase (non-hydrolysing)
MKTIAVFLGTRPEGIKMAPVIAALEAARDLRPVVISTGQHHEMLEQVIDVFGFRVDHDLAVMEPNQTLAGLTARLLTEIDGVLDRVHPDMALVQGDTTTVLAAALACFYRKIPIGHVEAGLRTGNIWSPFPEEVNRRLASPLVTLHFAPTSTARDNLVREGIDAGCILVTGNTVIDALQLEVARQRDPDVEVRIDRELSRAVGNDWDTRPFVLITGHRRESFGAGFEQICRAVAELAETFPDHRFVYPVHLNPQVQRPVHARLARHPNVVLTEPRSYRTFVALLRHCRVVLTDSGGVQEEAPGLGKPVLVMRDTTERPEGVEAGTVRLVGPHAERIVAGVRELLTDRSAYDAMARAKNPYGDGRAAGRIVERIASHLAERA